jgi:hypoxanthine-DNA glycosylase
LARAAAFAPVVDSSVRVLVLGSLPGGESLRRAQYYAHPRNAFWRLVGDVAGRELAALPYDDRLAALLDARIGLWDVIASAERAGSLDAAIRDPEHADLRSLVDGLPALRAVGFNGRTASKAGRRLLGASAGVALIDLPSSSPAHAGMTYANKLAGWRALGPYLV